MADVTHCSPLPVLPLHLTCIMHIPPLITSLTECICYELCIDYAK
jgi:hypothetical protein